MMYRHFGRTALYQGRSGRIYFADVPITSLGQPEKAESPMVYPNPASQEIYIQQYVGRSSSPKEVVAVNAVGQVFNLAFDQTVTNRLDVSQLPTGLYSLAWVQGGKRYTTKFRKE